MRRSAALAGSIAVLLAGGGVAWAAGAVYAGTFIPSQTDKATSKGVDPVKVSCQANPCTGKLTLRAALPPSTTPSRIGVASYTVSGVATVRVKLTAKAFSALKSAGSLSVNATTATKRGTSTITFHRKILLLR